MNVLDRFRLDGRRLFISGGSRGLGREMALALADVGADVVMTGRDRASLEEAAAAIRARGRQAFPIVADMSDPAACERACHDALATGPIHILINNVGDRRVSIPIEETPLETWHADDGSEPHQLLHLHEGDRRRDDCARRGRADHQHLLDERAHRQPRHRRPPLRNREGSDAALHAVRRGRLGAARDHRERDLPGLFMTEPNRQWAERAPM